MGIGVFGIDESFGVAQRARFDLVT